MRRIFWGVTVILASALAGALAVSHSGSATAGEEQALDTILPNMVERNQGGVVNIQSTTYVKSFGYYGSGYDDFFSQFFGIRPQVEHQTSLGSGFIIDQDGYILTNNHVVAGADKVVILWGDPKEPKQIKAKIIGTDDIVDLALLKLVHSPGKLKPLVLGDSDIIRVGQTAVAMGNPFGLSGTVTKGIISSLHRSIGQGPYDDFMQTDASINFGNSGGPLFNIKGEVIGINTTIRADGHGIGFAIPINLVKKLIPQLEKYGRVVRSWLGIVGENNRPAFQEQFGISGKPGVVVYSVVARHPAARSGLEAGDVIVSVDGARVKDIYDLEREVQAMAPGNTADILVSRVSRGGARETHVKITVEELPPSNRLPEGYNFM